MVTLPIQSATFALDVWNARHDSQKVDLVFVIDCTASMGSYINQVQSNVSRISEKISRTAFDVHLALVEYRDHPPEDSSFVTNVHDFTSSVEEMKGWVQAMAASGGGDIPEAAADGLDAALHVSYRPSATKICVLVTDAPPHGLDLSGDSMPNGCPSGHDPLRTCRQMAEQGIILYCIGCEPALASYRDFFMGLSHITGGQYVKLNKANLLSQVIINATLEEVENENLMGYVDDHLLLEFQRNEHVTVDELANSLHDLLRLNGNRSMRVQVNGEEIEAVSALGRQVSFARSLSDARRLMAGHFVSRSQEGAASEVFDITSLDEVTPRQCERLVRRSLARQRREPSEHVDCEMQPN